MKPLVFLCKLWLSVFKKEKKKRATALSINRRCLLFICGSNGYTTGLCWHPTFLRVSPWNERTRQKHRQRFCKYCCLWRPFLVMIRKQTKHLVSLNRGVWGVGGVLWELSSPKRRTHTRTIRARTRSTLLACRLAQLCTAWKPAPLLHFNYTTLSSRQLYRKHAQLK